MYRLNLLPRKVLITTDEVIAQSATDNDVDPRQLLSAIQIAEERFIKPAICKDLYYAFRDAKNVIVNDVNKDLLQEYLNEGLEDNQQLYVLKNGDIVNAIELVDDIWLRNLWNEHLWKLIAECVMYIASPTNFSRFTASGEMEANPKSFGSEGQGSASVELGKMKWKMDKLMQDRIDPLIASTQEWLCDNQSHFPLYNCRSCGKHNDGVSFKRKTGWIHVYENEKKNCEE